MEKEIIWFIISSLIIGLIVRFLLKIGVSDIKIALIGGIFLFIVLAIGFIILKIVGK